MLLQLLQCGFSIKAHLSNQPNDHNDDDEGNMSTNETASKEDSSEFTY